MKSYTDLQEGLYDPNIFKAFFLAGGPGSGKSYVVKKSTGGTGLKIVNSDDVFEKYLKQAKLEGVTGFILDLRGNPGGLLNQSVKVASHFLFKGRMVVYTQGRSENASSSR